LRTRWNLPSGSATGAPAAETRGARAPEALAFAALALPWSATLSVDVLAVPPCGVNVTFSW